MEYYQGGPIRHVGDLPSMGAERYGEKTAFSFRGEELSYQELEAEANRVANVLLEHGLESGDRVSLFVPNTPLFPSAFFGVVKAGGVPVSLNLKMDPGTLAFVLRDSGAEYLIGSPAFAEQVQDLAAVAEIPTLFLPGADDGDAVDLVAEKSAAPVTFDRVDRDFDDVACQAYTSGTTGRPKGVLLSHRNLLRTIESYTDDGMPVTPEESLLLVLPLFHLSGLALMGIHLQEGSEMVLHEKPEGDGMLRAIDEREITRFVGVPAMYKMMLRAYREDPTAYDLSSLTETFCAAAPLEEEVRKTIEDAWDVPMYEIWGMTETTAAGSIEPTRGVRKEAGCIGPPLSGVEMKLVDPQTRETKVAVDEIRPIPSADLEDASEQRVTGEIAIRGDVVFDGYHDRPEKTAAAFDDDGWFYTGDVGRVDGDGYFWFVDRTDDMMVVGGENVYPAEVEGAVYEHPDVAEVGVVSAPHEVKGEAPVAFVVPEEDAEVSEDELRSFALERLPDYAHPRRVFSVDQMPRSATRKVQRHKLKEEIGERLDGALEPTVKEL